MYIFHHFKLESNMGVKNVLQVYVATVLHLSGSPVAHCY